MKKFIKINLIILVIFCLLCSLYIKKSIATEPIENSNTENENQEDNEEKSLDDLEIEKSGLEDMINSSNEQIEFIESDLTATVTEIAEINQQLLDKKMEIDTIEAQENEIQIYIDKAEVELEKSTKKYEKQKEILEKRLVAMYEMGQTSYLDVLLSSNGIMDFLSNYYMINEIASADEELLETVNKEKEYNENLTNALESKREILNEHKKNRKKNEISLENMVVIKNNKLKELTDAEIELQKIYRSKIAEIAQLM